MLAKQTLNMQLSAKSHLKDVGAAIVTTEDQLLEGAQLRNIQFVCTSQVLHAHDAARTHGAVGIFVSQDAAVIDLEILGESCMWQSGDSMSAWKQPKGATTDGIAGQPTASCQWQRCSSLKCWQQKGL